MPFSVRVKLRLRSRNERFIAAKYEKLTSAWHASF